ncbi:translocase of chloroplast 159, chloroplastic-like [Ananas comosus]|uniref:Translocase of chloroplast 159, chloroplastic-like n=1 Tax=Ananas comosus TaxID=4615 RepID=A0A6P5FWA0_ANACO|nr:translocase of chloroplast 159, chloroplastic-like [Ananas comosus]
MASSSAPKLLIRAPLSSEDNDSPFSSDPDEMEEEEGFGTASEGDEHGDVPRGGAAPRGAAPPLAVWGSMPIAPVTLDEEDDEEAFEDSDGDGFSPVARVFIPDRSPALGEKGGALVDEGDGAVFETRVPVPAEGGDGVLGVEEEEATDFPFAKDESSDAAFAIESMNAEENEEGDETSTSIDSIDGDISVSDASQSNFGVGEFENSQSVDVGSLEKLAGANRGERDEDKVFGESSEQTFPSTVENTLDELNPLNDGASIGKSDALNRETVAAEGGETVLALEDSASSEGCIVGNGETDETLMTDTALNEDVNPGGNDDEGYECLNSDQLVGAPILESSEFAEQLLNESGEDYAQEIDGQGILDSDEDEEEEANEKQQVFDPDALAAALLKAATGSSITSQEACRIFSAEPEIEVSGKEKSLHDKVESIRVKFLRLVHRLGHSPKHFVAAQVLNRLTLADGIRTQMNRDSILESSQKKALQIEAEGKEDLDFCCSILLIGKSGVGKSATINSIFDGDKSKTDAFEPATNSVKVIAGIVDGVKIQIIDTPGLKPSLVDHSWNRRILLSIKKYVKKCSPDIVLYVDRLDIQTNDFNDLPLLKLISTTLGSSIWYNAVVALTHAASAPPEGPSGSPMSYEVFVAQKSIIVQQAIKLASGDFRLVNPAVLIENHPLCRRNTKGERVLPNGLKWRPELLLLCYTSKILSEADSLPKLPEKLFNFHHHSLPLPFLLSSLMKPRVHPKLLTDGTGEIGDLDTDLGDSSEVDQEQEEEDEYDKLPPFWPLSKAEIAKLTKKQRKAYFDEYDYRVKLLEKKQRKMLRRLAEMKKRGKSNDTDLPGEFYQDNAPPATVPDLLEEELPLSFDGDNPTYRYRFLDPTLGVMARPKRGIGWDHDCGYEGVIVEDSLALIDRFPAAISVDLTKDKKEFIIHLVSSISAKHGTNGSTLAGFDIQTFGQQLTYALRGETKFKNLKKNTTAGGISVTFLGENVATGVKLEDQLSIGKRVSLDLSAGAVRALSETAYAANLEVLLREKDNPIGQALSAVGLSLMSWRGDSAFGANLQSQFDVGRRSKMAVQVGLNNKLSGHITLRTTTSELSQIALVGILPIVISLLRCLRFSTTS